MEFHAALDAVRVVNENERDWVDYLTLAFAGFAAIGTVGAVCVALWQSNRLSRRELSVSGYRSKTDCTVTLTNQGFRPVTVDHVLFGTDDGFAVSAWPHPDDQAELHRTFSDGETRRISFPLPPIHRDDQRFTKLVVIDTHGGRWRGGIDPPLAASLGAKATKRPPRRRWFRRASSDEQGWLRAKNAHPTDKG